MRMQPRRAVPAATLIGAIVIGWAAHDLLGPTRIQARSTDRRNEDILTTATVTVQMVRTPSGQMLAHQDAVCYLDYDGAQLLAMVPKPQSLAQGTTVLGEFARRDLISDFQIPAGRAPHFMMTSTRTGQLLDAWDPLLVIETTTRKIAAYRVVSVGTVGTSNAAPKFELIEVRPLP